MGLYRRGTTLALSMRGATRDVWARSRSSSLAAELPAFRTRGNDPPLPAPIPRRCGSRSKAWSRSSKRTFACTSRCSSSARAAGRSARSRRPATRRSATRSPGKKRRRNRSERDREAKGNAAPHEPEEEEQIEEITGPRILALHRRADGRDPRRARAVRLLPARVDASLDSAGDPLDRALPRRSGAAAARSRPAHRGARRRPRRLGASPPRLPPSHSTPATSSSTRSTKRARPRSRRRPRPRATSTPPTRPRRFAST